MSRKHGSVIPRSPESESAAPAMKTAIGITILPEDALQAGELADKLWELTPDYGCDEMSVPVPLVLAIGSLLRKLERRQT